MEDLEVIKEISNEEIKNLIYTIRGKQVMLDSNEAITLVVGNFFI